MAFNYGGGTISGTPTLSNVNTLTGDVYAGQLLNVRGSTTGSHATLTSADGFDNSGTIALDATHASYYANLTVTGGTLTNTASGTINSNGTTSGTRTISANLTNNGTVNINTDTTFSKTGAQYINNGDLNIAASETLTVSGSGVNFINGPAGTIAGDGTLNLGTATFANNGRIEPGNSPGILTITGDVPFSDSAELGVEIFGLTVGSEYDRLVVSGQADIDGRLTVDLGSFIPDPSDSFTIMIAGELSGSFDNTPGNVLSLVQGTCDVIYNYDADTVTLTNFQDVPEPTAIGLIVMGGLVILRRRRRC